MPSRPSFGLGTGHTAKADTSYMQADKTTTNSPMQAQASKQPGPTPAEIKKATEKFLDNYLAAAQQAYLSTAEAYEQVEKLWKILPPDFQKALESDPQKAKALKAAENAAKASYALLQGAQFLKSLG